MFKLTFEQYLNVIVSELIGRLSTKCKVSIRNNEYGYGGLKTIAKEYKEFDSIRVDFDDWHYDFDTMNVEKSYKVEKDINEFVDIFIEQMKSEFVKQLMKEEKK